MSDPKQARLMLQVALRDLTALQGMTEPEVFADAIFGFHAQQAAEKGLKAWIAFLGQEYPLTHNIRTLLDILDSVGIDIEPLLCLTEYTPYGVRFRYEAADADDEPLHRERALSNVSRLLDQVDGLIQENDCRRGGGRVSPSPAAPPGRAGGEHADPLPGEGDGCGAS